MLRYSSIPNTKSGSWMTLSYALPRPAAVAHAKKLTPVSQGLLTVLRDELKIEKERYRTPEAVLEGAPGKFELQDKPNTNTLLLTRSYGKEDIFVEVDLEEQNIDEDEDEDEEGEEGAALPPVAFTVSLCKDSDVMTFKCESNGQYLRIKNVALDDSSEGEEEEEEEEADNSPMRLPPYAGPVFDELDETLQQALVDYLEERGVTPEFGYYLMELVADKLEVEYMNWLARMQKFVNK